MDNGYESLDQCESMCGTQSNRMTSQLNKKKVVIFVLVSVFQQKFFFYPIQNESIGFKSNFSSFLGILIEGRYRKKLSNSSK